MIDLDALERTLRQWDRVAALEHIVPVEDLRALIAELREAREVLRALEWSVSHETSDILPHLMCPACWHCGICDSVRDDSGVRHRNHADDCRLARVLR